MNGLTERNMSWSISFIGSPENISKALKENSEKLSGKSKEEYDAALPHIDALVNQNYTKQYPLVLKVDANGHGHDGYSNCSVSISQSPGILV